MPDDLNEARIRAAAHLSVARMHLDTADEALLEDIPGGWRAVDAVVAARKDLDALADEIMAPLGIGNVLQAVEEAVGGAVAGGLGSTFVGVTRAGREKIITAMVQAREAGAQDEVQQHRMVAGSHERPGGPECRCGAAWLYFSDRCATDDERTP